MTEPFGSGDRTSRSTRCGLCRRRRPGPVACARQALRFFLESFVGVVIRLCVSHITIRSGRRISSMTSMNWCCIYPKWALEERFGVPKSLPRAGRRRAGRLHRGALFANVQVRSPPRACPSPFWWGRFALDVRPPWRLCAQGVASVHPPPDTLSALPCPRPSVRIRAVPISARRSARITAQGSRWSRHSASSSPLFSPIKDVGT